MRLLAHRISALLPMLATGCQVITGLDDYEIDENIGNCDPAQTEPGMPLWMLRLGDSARQMPWDVAAHESGIVVVGELEGSMELAGLPPLVSEGAADGFVVKLDLCGKPLWAQTFAGPFAQEARGVAIGPGGEIYVAGAFAAEVTIGGNVLTSAGDADMFVAKLAPDGALVWTKAFGGTGGDHARDVAVSRDGATVAIGGHYMDSVDFEGTTHVATAFNDAVLVRMNADGAVIGAHAFPGSTAEEITSVAFDESGGLRLLAHHGTALGATFDFGGGALIASGGVDVAAAKLDENASHVWSKSFGSATGDFGSEVIAMGEGTLLSGFFESSIDFGGAAHQADPGFNDGFVAHLGPSGERVWSFELGQVGYDAVGGLAVDPSDGSVLAAGVCGSTLALQNDAPVLCEYVDPFLLRIDGQGNYGLATERMYGEGAAGALKVALTPDGHPVVMGLVEQELRIGEQHIASLGAQDVFIIVFKRQ